ncbi:Glutathionylspermidine synthase, partial [Colletotrichum caudatum]
LAYGTLSLYGMLEPYWPDDRYYSFTLNEITLLENAAKDVFAMCCKATDYLVEHPDIITKKIAVLAFTLKLRVPKLYEFNADTPTSLIEAGLIQWLWLEQTGHGNDQFNSIHEALVEGWRRNPTLIKKELGHKPTVHFAFSSGDRSDEDMMNTTLLLEACQQAGLPAKRLTMEEISLSTEDRRFYDAQGQHIDVIFKLDPWEYMIGQEFARPCFEDMDNVGKRDEEAILWDLFKNDPRSKWLLPTYFDNEAPVSLTSFARKPIFARECADIVLKENGKVVQDSSVGWYGEEGYVIQELSLLPEFKDIRGKSHYPVLGLWMVDGDPLATSVRIEISRLGYF